MVDYEVGAALVLRPISDDEGMLEIAAVPLADLLEQTLELIGTNVNGNPYGNVRLYFPVNVHFLVCRGRAVLKQISRNKSLFIRIAVP